MCSLHSQLTLPQSLTAAGELAVQADGARQFLSVRKRWEAGRKTAGIQPACLTWPVPGILRRIRLGCWRMATELAFSPEAATQEFIAPEDPNLGPLAVELQRQTQELQRRAVEAGTQARADANAAVRPTRPPAAQAT